MLTRERPIPSPVSPAEELTPERSPGWLDRTLVWAPAVNREILLYILLIGLGAVLRFWDLGTRAQHHDESLHALYSWYLFTGRGFQADPLMHGPLLFHFTALFYFLFGDSDYTSRILSALAGTALIGLPFFLRSYLGRWGALMVAVFFLISPSYLYYSRFIRQEATLLLFTLVIAIGIWRYLAAPKQRYLILIALALGLSFTDKATTYFTVGIFGSFIFFWRWRELLGALRNPTARLKQLSPAGDLFIVLFTLGLTQGGALAIPVLHALNINLPTTPIATIAGTIVTGEVLFKILVVAILVAISAAIGLAWNARLWWKIAAAFFIPYFLLYTTMLTNVPGFGTGMWGMMAYWMEQHGVQRGNQPGYYYLILTSIYEFLPAILGVIAIVAIALRRRIDRFGFFLIWWAAGSYLTYSLAGEKMPWLIVHPILPMMLLGGRALGGWIQRFPRPLARSGAFWLTALAALLGLFIIGALVAVAAGTGAGAGNFPAVVIAVILFVLLALIAVFLFRQGQGLGGSTVGRAVLAALLIVGFGLTVRAAWQASYYHGDVPVEMLVYTQTSPDVPIIANRIRQLADLNGGRENFPVTVDSNESFTWPWAWYLRDFGKVDYPNLSTVTGPPLGTVLLAHASNVDRLQPYLDKYGPGQRYKLRWWFPEDYRGLDIPKLGQLVTDPNVWKIWWRYFMYRDLVNPLGSSDAVAFFPPDSGPSGGVTPAAAAAQPAAPQQPAGQPGAPALDLPVLTTIGGQRSSEPGQFNDPKAMAVDPSGNLYVVDSLNHRVQKFSPEGQLLGTAGSEGTEPGQFKEPWGIAVGPDGSVYVADTWNHRIQKLDADLNLVGQWGGFFDTRGVFESGTGQFYGPRSIAIGNDGSVYVTDTGNKRIQKFTPDGQFLAVYGGTGSEPGQFQEPVGLATDSAGNIYVADTWNHRIQKFDPSMQFVEAWPISGWGSVSVVNKPYLAVAPDGTVFASDPENKRVFAFGPDGQPTGVLGGAGGPAFTLPIGVAVAPDGDLWVADAGQHQVQSFDRQ